MFDDEISFANAHRNAQALMPDDFFYNVIDDSAPFGNDDGWDVLYSLKEWIADNPGVSKKEFVDEKLAEWNYPAFNYQTTDIKDAIAFWNSTEIGFRLLMGIDQAIIATAFGQLYLEGKMDPDIKEIVRIVLGRQMTSEMLDAWDDMKQDRKKKLQKLIHVVQCA